MNKKLARERWKQLQQVTSSLLHKSIQTNHNRIIACGLLVALCLLSIRVGWLVIRTLQGTSAAILFAAFCFGVYEFWKRRRFLTKLQAPEEDQLIGYFLIFIGVLVAPFYLFSEWSITVVGILILLGVAISSWGILFIKKCSSPTILLLFGLFPHPATIANAAWELLAPDQTLERFMAWSAGAGLRIIGQPAEVTNIIIDLSGKAVAVQKGCNGFGMAMGVAGAGLLMSFLFKQNLRKTVLLVVIGIALALAINIPRIMLMALSNAYWGEAQFKFWHDGWGSQIFSTILFTAYYYVAMAIIQQKRSNVST